MIKGNSQIIKKDFESILYASISKAHIGEFNINLESEANARLKSLLVTASSDISDMIVELQVVNDDNMTHVTGILNKKLVMDMAKLSVFKFFNVIIGSHQTYANSKTKDFVRDFKQKISMLCRRWKAAVPKKVKKPRKINKL